MDAHERQPSITATSGEETSVGTLDVQHHDDVLTVTFNRPERLNALRREDLDALPGNLDGNDVRAMVFRGAGDRAFSAGVDVIEPAELDTTLEGFLSKVTAHTSTVLASQKRLFEMSHSAEDSPASPSAPCRRSCSIRSFGSCVCSTDPTTSGCSHRDSRQRSFGVSSPATRARSYVRLASRTGTSPTSPARSGGYASTTTNPSRSATSQIWRA